MVGIAIGVHAAIRYGPKKVKEIVLEKIKWPEDSTSSYVKETFELTQDIHKLVSGNEVGKPTGEKRNGEKNRLVVVGNNDPLVVDAFRRRYYDGHRSDNVESH